MCLQSCGRARAPLCQARGRRVETGDMFRHLCCEGTPPGRGCCVPPWVGRRGPPHRCSCSAWSCCPALSADLDLAWGSSQTPPWSGRAAPGWKSLDGIFSGCPGRPGTEDGCADGAGQFLCRWRRSVSAAPWCGVQWPAGPTGSGSRRCCGSGGAVWRSCPELGPAGCE